jgi:hypothetical protein
MTQAQQLGGAGGRRHRWSRGDRLRAAREHSPGRPSQAQWAVIIGFSRNTVARYEADAVGADKPIVILRWAEKSGFDPRWLWQGDDDDPESEVSAPVTLCYPAYPVGWVA